MQWLRRVGRPLAPADAAPEPSAPEPVERSTPGLAALFERIGNHDVHAVLDLGPGVGSTLAVYNSFARWVRFADLIAAAASPARWAAAVDALPANPARPYDLVFAWDILDHIPPHERPRLIERLDQLSGPHATLFLIARSGDTPAYLLPFGLAGGDHMLYLPSKGIPPLHPILIAAEIGPVLAPFQVRRAFSSPIGLREYLAVK